MTQTTLSVDDTRGIIAALYRRFTDVVGPGTEDICYATQNRQTALRELSKQVDVIFVVGATNSSNSNRLREIGIEAGVPTYLDRQRRGNQAGMGRRRGSGRHHRRRLGAGSDGRGCDRGVARSSRRSRSLDSAGTRGKHRIPRAGSSLLRC